MVVPVGVDIVAVIPVAVRVFVELALGPSEPGPAPCAVIVSVPDVVGLAPAFVAGAAVARRVDVPRWMRVLVWEARLVRSGNSHGRSRCGCDDNCQRE